MVVVIVDPYFRLISIQNLSDVAIDATINTVYPVSFTLSTNNSPKTTYSSLLLGLVCWGIVTQPG